MILRLLPRKILFALSFCGFFPFVVPVPVPVLGPGSSSVAARFLVSGPAPAKSSAPAKLPVVPATPGSRMPGITAGMEEDILRFVNLHRDSMGLKPLQLNTVESGIAAKHSRDMASGKSPFGHEGIDQRIKAIGKQLGAVMAAAENVAYGQTTAREVVNEWLHSPGHRKNIEGDYTLTGIGLANDPKGIPYYTQIFTK